MRIYIIILQLFVFISLSTAQGIEKVLKEEIINEKFIDTITSSIAQKDDGVFEDTDIVFSIYLTDVSFQVFVDEIFKISKVKIYFSDNQIKGLRVTLNSDKITVVEAVKIALSGTELAVIVWNEHLVVIPSNKVISQLPSFKQNYQQTENLDLNTKTLTAAEERYITGRKSAVTQTITVGASGGPINGSKAKIMGRVLDQVNGEPLFNATMFISELRTGGVTDLNGYLSIIIKPGKYNAIFEILGYERKKYVLEVHSDGNFQVRLNKAVIEMKEFVVYGDRQMNMKAKDPGIEKISMKSIKELPMMMGERDILKVSTTLPGIVSTGEGASGLNVRGGGSDQNAFYINKIPIYNTSHLFGFFPAFNSDIIKDFSIYKGHIPAQYGGRLSSVFNIVTRQGNRKRFTVHGGLSPITGNIVVEGPMIKDSSSFLLSLRSSYSDWILKRIKDPAIRASSANFNDFSTGLNYDIRKTQLSLFVYHSFDRFRLSDINEYAYSNNGASLTFSKVYKNTVRAEFTVIGSEYDFKTIDSQELSSAYEHAYKMGHYEFRGDFKHMLTDEHTLDYGVDIIAYRLDRGTVKPSGINSLRIPVSLGKEQGLESGIYISDSYDPMPWLNLTAGFRYAMYNPLGPKTVYTYFPELPVDPRYINDTLNYDGNKPIRWYSEPDFRLAANLETDDQGSVKIAFNQMHQNLFMLNNTITVSPNAQWKLADYHLKPSRSEQLSIGIFRILGKSGLDASIEGYIKRTSNYPEFKDGANFLESPQAEVTVLQGTQNAYGMECFIKRSNHKLEGWISYTYSRTSTTVDGNHSWDLINDGDAFPSNFDIPHSLNTVLNYHFTRRITFSSIIAYQTGKPITYPVSVYYIDGIPYLDYSKRNAYRIPDYFRTDLSVTIEGNLKKKKLLHSSLVLSVYNLTGRANPYSVYFKNEKGRIKSYQYSVIGVPILTATWIFKFGNYASD